MGVDVVAPDGRRWHVTCHIRWPHLRSDAGLAFDSFPFVDVGFDDSIIGGLIAALIIGIVVTILVIVLLPLVLLFVELVFVIVATLFFRRAWIVRAACSTETREWRVKGIFGSRAAVREVADELRRGVVPVPDGQVVV